MKLTFALLLPVIAASLPMIANASQALAQQKNCMACHAVGTRVVGPSYKEVAAKYASQADATAMLAERITKGSSGRWGFVPMPPNASLSAADANTLANWILQQK